MAYNVIVRIKSTHKQDARRFLDFLKAVGRKYPVKFAYRNIRRWHFEITFDKETVSRVDILLHELVLNRGLYYYFLSLPPNQRSTILDAVMLPIFKTLVEAWFRVPYTGFLRRHILGRLPQGKYVPGDTAGDAAHSYELAFRRWEIGIIDDWNLIKDADAIITRFLLEKAGHMPGAKSPNFPLLMNRAYASGIGIHREVRRAFDQLHRARAGGLHRLQSSLTHQELSSIATRVYMYFNYFDEFDASQRIKTVRVHRRRYRRIRYGEETWPDAAVQDLKWSAHTEQHPCGDCFAMKGQFHCEGCDIEQCPKCGQQLLGHGGVDLPY